MYYFDVDGHKILVLPILGVLEDIGNLMNYLGEIDDNIWFQAIRFKEVYSLKHLLHSVIIGVRRFLKGENISKKLHMEILLPLAGTRQIREALYVLKPQKGEPILALFIGLNVTQNKLLQIANRVMENLGFIRRSLQEFVNADCKLCKMINENMLNATLGKTLHEKLEKNIIMMSSLTYMKM
mgnify:CR=1 FL=1